MSRSNPPIIEFDNEPEEVTALPYQDNSFNPDRFKGVASNFLKGFMEGRGMNTAVDDDDDDEGFQLPEGESGLDLTGSGRSQKYATQRSKNAINFASQDYGRGVQQGQFSKNYSLDKFTPTADFDIQSELKERNIDYTSANTNLSADQGVTSTVPNPDDFTTSVADEISSRSNTAFTNATADDADDVDTSTLGIYTQGPSNVNTTIDTNLPTDAEKTELENFQINTLNSATKNDPALQDNFGNPDTSGLAIYEDNEDPGINVNDRLTENNVDIYDSQYRGSGDEIDINATGAVEEELRTRQNDAYGEATENDPWDATYNPEGASGDYDPQANEDNYNRITPPVDNQPINTPSPTPDPTPPVTTPDPIETPEDALASERDARIEERWQMHLNSIDPNEMDQLVESSGGLDAMKQQWMNTMEARMSPQRGYFDANMNYHEDTRGRTDIFGADSEQLWINSSGYYNEDGTLKTPFWQQQQQQQTRAGQNASSDASRSGESVDQTSLQPIGTEGVVNDNTTNAQQQGPSAADEINVEAETRDNQLALQSNEVVAAGGADTALMPQPEATESGQMQVASRPEYEVQGFKDQAQMDRFETGYADYLDTAKRFGRNINADEKDKYKKAFFDIYEPAYEYDQKTQAHNAVIDEAKQRGVDTGVFKNVGEVNEWIGRLNKKQAGKFVGYSNEAKENFLIENKLDTMKYNQI